MGLIRDKIAGNARESVQRAAYTSGGSAGFEELPSIPTVSDSASRAKIAEGYMSDNVSGTNLYRRPRMHK